MCAPVLYTVNGSFPFLPDWNEKKQTLVFLSYSPELIIISHYFWLRSACTHGYMGACLCGCVISVALQEHGVCTWLVFSRQLTGLWWLLLLHLCFGDVRGEWKPKRGRENGDEMKKNVHDGRGKDWEENNTGFKRANPGEGGAERRGTQKRKRTDGLFVYTGLFLWGSVCVFQLWIVDYAKKFMSLSVSLSQPFLSFCRGGLQTFKWSRKHCLWQHSHHPAGAPPAEADRAEEVIWVCTSQTDTLQQEWTGWDLAAIKYYTLPAPWAALIHCSVLHHDNPAHMSQPHTQ